MTSRPRWTAREEADLLGLLDVCRSAGSAVVAYLAVSSDGRSFNAVRRKAKALAIRRRTGWTPWESVRARPRKGHWHEP